MSNIAYSDISLLEEVAGCLLCNKAPCTKACPHGIEVDSIIRSLRFENKKGAANKLPEILPCKYCETKDCMSACLKGRINRSVPIDDIMGNAKEIVVTADKVNLDEVNLSIKFCGVHCENPFFLSSSVVGSNYEMVAKAFDMGWAGGAFKTIGTFVPKEVSIIFYVLRK